MKPLDLNTLVYIIAAISLLFAVLMLLFSQKTPEIKGPLHWSLGSFSAVLSSFLFAAYPVVNGFFAIVISSSFTVLTLGLYWAGIRAFKELKINYWILVGLVLLQFLVGAFFYLIVPMPNVRMVAYSFVSILVCVLAIRELVKPVAKPYQFAFRLSVGVFIISILTSVYRIGTIIKAQPGIPYAPTSANLTFYFFINITQALLLFSFALLISTRISEQLKKKVEDQRKFYSIIAHDLSGPVGMINVMLNMANQDRDIEEKQRTQIYNEVEKLSMSTHHLLQNLLYWSRSQLDSLTPYVRNFDLNKVIVENIDLMQHIANSKNVSICYNTAETDLGCFADERMISTVFRNLISNAIKYSHAGGAIDIAVEKSEKLTTRIKDNGVGMSEEVLKNLFVSGKNDSVSGTAGERGTGLGLMLSKEFVKGNNGTISVKSNESAGTEVVVTLPVAL
jgi:signal transduction histidine kinase